MVLLAGCTARGLGRLGARDDLLLLMAGLFARVHYISLKKSRFALIK